MKDQHQATSTAGRLWWGRIWASGQKAPCQRVHSRRSRCVCVYACSFCTVVLYTHVQIRVCACVVCTLACMCVYGTLVVTFSNVCTLAMKEYPCLLEVTHCPQMSSNVLKWITSANVDSKITAWYTTPFKLQLELFSEDIPHTLLWYTYNRGTKWPWVIGASLSEPHITVTAFAEVVCMYVWPYTVNFRWSHVNISWRLNAHE